MKRGHMSDGAKDDVLAFIAERATTPTEATVVAYLLFGDVIVGETLHSVVERAHARFGDEISEKEFERAYSLRRGVGVCRQARLS